MHNYWCWQFASYKLVVVVVVVGACFENGGILYATRYDAESQTYSISIRAYVPHTT